MGEYADSILAGDVCMGCFKEIASGDGYPVYCKKCQSDNKTDRYGDPIKEPKSHKKTRCPECNKKVKVKGLVMHRQDVHGYKK